MSYHHLTQIQRSQIQVLKSMQCSQKQMAKIIGIHPSTVCRELKRNKSLRGYRYKQAHHLALTRRIEASSSPTKMTTPVVTYIEEKLTEEQWSPEQISGVLKANSHGVSHTWIYRHIWEDRSKGGTLWRYLRHRGKKYNYKRGKLSGRGCIPGRVDIANRPSVVEQKKRIGDWEADTIVGAGHKGAIVSLVDRRSKYTHLVLLPNRQSNNVREAICRALTQRIDGLAVHTITYDNGKEFSQHQAITAATGGQGYFATPYHSWERGLNEHTNGLVRQYLPKKTVFTEIDAGIVLDIETKLNNRPRKVLGYKTPLEVLQGKRRPQKIALQG